jgi:hypothetical protein
MIRITRQFVHAWLSILQRCFFRRPSRAPSSHLLTDRRPAPKLPWSCAWTILLILPTAPQAPNLLPLLMSR